jgi:Domain of unknown function (DUF1707)
MSAQDTMRVSDAERAEVADRLSHHFGDGRLDEAEFNERVDRAMKAKTRADFAGLFDDLPGGDTFASGQATAGAAKPPMAPPPNWPSRRRLRHPVLTVVLVIILVSALSHAAVPWFFFGPPWLLIGLIAFLFLRHHDRHSHYRH